MVYSSFPVAGAIDEEHVRGTLSWELFEELRRLGYVQGQNLLAEGISGHGRSERYPELVHDVVGRSPDVIIAISNPLVQAFKEATASK
jgi:putative ABC transport system substrate-binding protein